MMIDIAKDYARYPLGRYLTDGPNSGERLRVEVLEPALRQHQRVTVILDGDIGYASSFIDEAFGGLVRNHNFLACELERKLTVEAKSNHLLVAEVWASIRDARPAA